MIASSNKSSTRLWDSLISKLAVSVSPGLPPGLNKYENDPIGFCENELASSLTDDQKTILDSLIKYRITIVESANSLGKTWIASRAALWFLRCHVDAQVYMAAAPPEDNLRNLLWGELDASLINASPAVHDGLIRRSLSLTYGPRWWCKGLTIPTTGTPEQRQARFSGKHAPYLLFILDEADAIGPEVQTGIESCLTGGYNRELIILNPRHPSGWVYSMRENPDVNVITLSAFNHPNVITGKDVIPGAVDRETTVRRIQTWTRPVGIHEKTEDTISFVVPGFLDGRTTCTNDGEARTPLVGGEIRVVTEGFEVFDHMVLGRYPARAGRQLISRNWVKDAQKRYKEWAKEHGEKPPEKIKGKIGIDIGIDTDPTVLCKRYGDWVAPFVFWKTPDPDESADKVKNIMGEEDYERIFIDITGAGHGYPNLLRHRGFGNISGIKVGEKPTIRALMGEKDIIGEFTDIRDQLMWAVREWLRSDEAMIPEDPLLEAELITPTYSPDGKKIKIMKKLEIRQRLSGRSCDRFDALALTFAPETSILIGLI